MSDTDTEEFLKGHRIDEESDDLDTFVDVTFAENAKLQAEAKKLHAQIAALEAQLAEVTKERNDLEVKVNDFWMNFAQVEEQLAEATRPEMVRELPKVEGWYWMKSAYDVTPVLVYEFDGRLRVKGLDRVWGFVDEAPSGTLWSATPIPHDPFPKEPR